ncbi:MAG: hypothetical protein H7Y27_09735 [Gemmatimonadaceae bacterium]|nr:hypothetical protein [Chitinophagaceae bacterium]
MKFSKQTWIALAFIIVIAALRLTLNLTGEYHDLSNFSGIGAMAIFGGAYFKNQGKAFAFPVLALLITDLILAQTIYKPYSNGFLYGGWYWVYGSFILMVVVGRFLKNRITLVNIVVSVIVVTMIHWLVTNFGVWIGGGTDVVTGQKFTRDIAGFWRCLYLAIPFERNFIAGTMAYSAIMFGGMELVKSKAAAKAVPSSE